MECPNCHKELDEIGCEKTITCPDCGLEWKYDYDVWGFKRFTGVEKDDPIYWDR